MADGWLPLYRTVKDASEAFSKLERYLSEEGRDIGEIGIETFLRYEGENPTEWRRIADEWKKAGATHMNVNTMGQGFKTAEEHISAIEAYAEALDVNCF
jgi:hypothetical protein